MTVIIYKATKIITLHPDLSRCWPSFETQQPGDLKPIHWVENEEGGTETDYASTSKIHSRSYHWHVCGTYSGGCPIRGKHDKNTLI